MFINNPTITPEIIPTNKLTTIPTLNNKLSTAVTTTTIVDPLTILLYSFDNILAQNINEIGNYLKLSKLSKWVEVRNLKEGDYISVPDYKTNTIKWAKIASIKTLEPQHVYDLSIEGTRNFIANDIVAHNTYLATSSGNVGIGTTTPASTLTITGNLAPDTTTTKQNYIYYFTKKQKI